ncbi:MAG: hypothetical protein OXQ90_04275 [Gammaproteobacteria bacterium]|nr:hypothetical protein [Gammaproteobacteria bacterium]
MHINNGGPDARLDSIVLFPCDGHSIPFQHGVKLNLRGKHLVRAVARGSKRRRERHRLAA